ncbi:MAG: homoserine dehydrogenase [Sphingomonadaceae bacterium]|uniref:homoserine dehydrogenase n=1 Tax=Thermaurantiacus sp. TaxID=2820283 RepID=UPI00298EF93C|nr:homoserine dehydrogenase [Thermaurantiacus sp.]MCS6987086.1 homoserine dehydrogenase [Sphingomonadaceae bacterium]MDW8415576.1 homoserine dehydrogenase [Thermaurantiacus sp.]
MAAPLRIGLAGLGTVGAGVIRLLEANVDLVARRAGRPIQVAAVSARDRTRARGVDLSAFAWEDDATRLAAREDVDVVVELIGGADGPALTLARATLAAGKPFVTANKAMLAHHGLELARLADDRGAALRFEAAVAGGIPVIKGLREGAAANRLVRVYGILNGTSNYILSRMGAAGLDFAEALREAQAAGFAEADPSFDVDGVDAAHKLSILASLAFGTRPDLSGVQVEGIRHVRLADIREARALGHEIRLIGRAEIDGDRLHQQVTPALVPAAHPLAAITGALNAVVAEGDFVGRLLFVGAGAGAGPTASAVVADLVGIARGEAGPAFSLAADLLAEARPAQPGPARFYLRLDVADRPGVLADVAAVCRDAHVSIESLSQPAAGPEGTTRIVMVTHESPEPAARTAAERLAGLSSTLAPPLLMPLLPLEG